MLSLCAAIPRYELDIFMEIEAAMQCSSASKTLCVVTELVFVVRLRITWQPCYAQYIYHNL